MSSDPEMYEMRTDDLPAALRSEKLRALIEKGWRPGFQFLGTKGGQDLLVLVLFPPGPAADPPVVNVPAPVVNVPAPVVNVPAPVVHIDGRFIAVIGFSVFAILLGFFALGLLIVSY